MLERADKASAEAQATYSRAKDMASIIPFGQPILIGHHSEQRDRNYRNKIHKTFRKSPELDGRERSGLVVRASHRMTRKPSKNYKISWQGLNDYKRP